jgi:hypothetical protein
VMQLRKSRFFLFARGSQLDNVVTSPWKITNHFRGIYRIYSNLIKENWRMSICNRLHLQTLGCQPVMPKNLPYLWRESRVLLNQLVAPKRSESEPRRIRLVAGPWLENRGSQGSLQWWYPSPGLSINLEVQAWHCPSFVSDFGTLLAGPATGMH